MAAFIRLVSAKLIGAQAICANKSRRAALSHRDEVAQPQEQEQEI